MGFRAVHYLNTNEPHICLYRDSTTKNQEELKEELSNANVKIVRSLDNTDYNNKEFVVEDVDGRWIAFGIKVD